MFVPFSMMMVSTSIGLVASAKIRNPEFVNLIGIPLVLVPTIISFISYRMKLESSMQVYLILGITSIILSTILSMFGKRILNRLAFIAN